jgi:putative nucleotidyltransferase with HDIG domain
MQDQERRPVARLWRINRRFIKITILVITSSLTLAALVFPIASRQSYFPLQVGDVAQQDIQAPAALSFPSQYLTEQERIRAESQVESVFLPSDPAIARRQVELLRAALNFIGTVRADSYANDEQKLTDLSALESIQLSREESERILALNESRWQMVQQEALTVIERVMRNTIREGQVNEAQRSIATLISFALAQDLASIVTDLVAPFIVPNSLYSEDQTAAARKAAREQVAPVIISYASDETIIRRGEIITQNQWEALVKYGLITEPDNVRESLSTTALVVLLSIFIALYSSRRRLPVLDGLKSLALIAMTFLVFLYAARLVIPNRTVLPYLYPLPAFGLAIACLFNIELSMVLTLVLSILAAYGLPNSLDLTVFYIVSAFFGILILGKAQRIGNFFWAGAAIGGSGIAVIIAYRLTDTTTDLVGLTTLAGAAIFNGMASASLTLILQFMFAQILGLATALQMLEISRPDHPLQQFILTNAPGSYQHSLQVAIMAEQAAEKIGADALVVRVGAIYHDAGKALNPSFFIENQVPGKLNPHDDLDPADSAQTIIRHVTDSVQLAKKHHLPSRMMDFMREHHGTLITRYQYAKALEAADNNPEKVDLSKFRYPGPRPQSRETALLMLADGAQARARAELPQDEEHIHTIVRKVIEFCQREGQLDDTRLTLKDLSTITDSFVNTLKNTYHPRIRYPEINPNPQPAAQAQEDPAKLQEMAVRQNAAALQESAARHEAGLHREVHQETPQLGASDANTARVDVDTESATDNAEPAEPPQLIKPVL